MDQQTPYGTRPPVTPAAAAGAVMGFLNRHLTAVALVVLVLGSTMLGLTLARHLSADGAEQSPVTAAAALSLPGPAGVDANELSTSGMLARSLEPFTTIPDRPRDQVISYTVKPGDTLVAIANRFGLDRNTLFWSNSNTLGDNVHFLQTGIDLNILPVDGVYHIADGSASIQNIADKYEVSPEVIIESPYNELEGYTPSDVPPWGMKIVVPGGTREIVDWRPPIIETVDQRTGTVVRGFMPGMGGSCPSIAGGGGTGSWAPPLSYYTITQGYYPGHSGLDLANVIGTPVTAADTGVVIFSGWVPIDWGYGILVVLDHGNGFTSYYAHLNGTTVGCGQTVPRGSVLGYVGSTGKSSGPHLHFEIRWNHTPDNPANYIAFGQ